MQQQQQLSSAATQLLATLPDVHIYYVMSIKCKRHDSPYLENDKSVCFLWPICVCTSDFGSFELESRLQVCHSLGLHYGRQPFFFPIL